MGCIYSSPIKRSATDQQATDCNGTECYYDPDYINTDTIVNVTFPENLTDVALTVLPLIPNLMIKHEQQIQNLTSVAAQLLQSQLSLSSLLSERLPVPSPPPRDCKDVASAGFYHSGIYRVYTITSEDILMPFEVYCDFDTTGAWTVFQRRFEGTVDFFRGWDEYENGFGSADGEFWAGLRQIHRITKSGLWLLRIDMEAFDGEKAYAAYDSFSVGDASTNYTLNIGTFSGTAGDSLAYHNNTAFSAMDRDNDECSCDCANLWKGGWWYSNCIHSNLNGPYLGPTSNSWSGNVWRDWKGYDQSLKITEMKMRRAQ